MDIVCNHDVMYVCLFVCLYVFYICDTGAWLREHLASDYANAWAEIYWNRPSTEFPGQHLVADESVQDSGAPSGRWNNFYVESINQLANVSPKIDGLYLVRSAVGAAPTQSTQVDLCANRFRSMTRLQCLLCRLVCRMLYRVIVCDATNTGWYCLRPLYHGAGEEGHGDRRQQA
eukprot:COSAG05_NODE_3903_length_1779_cov_2.110119_3_plen_174_part_00